MGRRDRFTMVAAAVLAAAGALLGPVAPAGAGELTPGLARRVANARANAPLAVVVRLEGTAEAADTVRPGGSLKRRARVLVERLKRRAAVAEAPVRRVLGEAGEPEPFSLWASGRMALRARPGTIRRLAELEGVVEIREDSPVAAPATVASPAAESGWNLKMLNAPELWARGVTGEGVVVAVVDTGVDARHAALAGRWRSGPGGWFDPYGEHSEPADPLGHGTQVAGLIVGGDIGGVPVGVAPGARWIGVKIFDDAGVGTVSGIHRGLQWLLDPDGNPGTDDLPQVVNNSWGFRSTLGSCDHEFDEDIAALRAAGVTVVFSAGNEGPNPATALNPAANPHVLSVGAVDQDGAVIAGSSRGPSPCGSAVFPSLVAPGESVLTTDLTLGGIDPEASAWVSGTSFAAAHLAGALALLRSTGSAATLGELEVALFEGAEDLEDDGPDDDSGYGLIDLVAAEAVLARGTAGGTGTTVFVDEAAFSNAVAGDGIRVESFEAEDPWGAVRTVTGVRADSAAELSNGGITWRSNHAAGRITTGGGAARTGSWALYATPHGDPAPADPLTFMHDGVTGRSEGLLHGVGGWFSGTSGGQLSVVLDGDQAHPIGLGPLESAHRFYGVVREAGFASFEFVETEGTAEDPKLVFVDDVTLAAAEAGMTGVVPGVANTAGAQGSDWHSDLYLHNASGGPIGVDLHFSPTGQSVGPASSFVLESGTTMVFRDVVASLFGQSGSGAVFWRVNQGDPAGLLVAADTFNRVDAVRRYGQQVPGVRWAQTPAPGTPIVVPALAGPFRTNLGIVSGEGCTRVELRVFDRFGLLKASRTVDVAPLSWIQLDGVFRKVFPGLLADPEGVAAAESLHRLEMWGVDGRAMDYASIIDNRSNDSAYLLGQWEGAAAEEQWLPGAALTGGLNGSRWSSDLFVLDRGTGSTVDLGFYRAGQDNGVGVPTDRLDLDPGTSSFEENVLASHFGASPPTQGSLGWTAQAPAGGVFAWMRTFTRETAADGGEITYGVAVRPLGRGRLVTPERPGRIFGLSHGPEARSNLILHNGRRQAGALVPVTVRVEVLSGSGAPLAQRDYALMPGEAFQHTRFLPDLGVPSLDAGALRITLMGTAGAGFTGGVDAMVTEVNGNTTRGTNDSRLLRVEIAPAP